MSFRAATPVEVRGLASPRANRGTAGGLGAGRRIDEDTRGHGSDQSPPVAMEEWRERAHRPSLQSPIAIAP